MPRTEPWVAWLDEYGHVRDATGLTIVALDYIPLSFEYPAGDVQTWSGGRLPGVTLGLVRVRSADGIEGLGETYGGNFAPEVVRACVDVYRDALLGEDASEIAALWEKCYSRMMYWGRFGITISALSAVETALWDLVGKATGTSVVDLLGGPRRDALPRYASGGMDGTPEEWRREQEEVMRQGFRALKIRGGDGPEADFAKAKHAREGLDARLGVAIDVVQGSNPAPWTAREAVEVGRQLEGLGLLWYEEPCSSTDIAGYRACREALAIPIAGGESCTTIAEIRRFIEGEALDIVQPDAAHLGGIIETVKTSFLAERHGVEMAVHAWLGAGSMMANYHAAFAAPTCSWLEYPIQPNPFVVELLAEPLTVVDGLVHRPIAPGLGIALPDGFEERHPYRSDLHYYFGDTTRRGSLVSPA